MTQEFLWVFLLSVLSSQNDTNLATNTNILLILLLGLSNANNWNGNNWNGNNGNNNWPCGCNRIFGFNNFQ